MISKHFYSKFRGFFFVFTAAWYLKKLVVFVARVVAVDVVVVAFVAVIIKSLFNRDFRWALESHRNRKIKWILHERASPHWCILIRVCVCVCNSILCLSNRWWNLHFLFIVCIPNAYFFLFSHFSALPPSPHFPPPFVSTSHTKAKCLWCEAQKNGIIYQMCENEQLIKGNICRKVCIECAMRAHAFQLKPDTFGCTNNKPERKTYEN